MSIFTKAFNKLEAAMPSRLASPADRSHTARWERRCVEFGRFAGNGRRSVRPDQGQGVVAPGWGITVA